MAERTVTVRLWANIKDFKSGMAEAVKSMKDVGDKSKDVGDKSTTSLSRIADHARKNEQAWQKTGQVFVGVGVAAAAGVGVAITKFAQFDKQMSAVQAATLGSATEMEGLRKVAIKAGQDTAYSAQEAAGGVEQLAKAGVSTADIMGGGLAGSLALAAAGELDVAAAAEIAASTMVQFNLEGSEVGTVADALAAGANKAQGSVQDLGLALSYAGVPAAALGLSVEETTGVLGLFANAGITGEKAGTALRSMLVSLQNPSAKAATTMSELGIEVFDAEGNFIGMEATAGVLADKMSGLDQQTRGAALATIFGNEALGAATSLYNGGSGAVAEWTDAVSESGYAAEVAATRLDNLAGDVQILRGSLETALIGLGGSGSGPLREVTQDLTTMVNVFSSLPDGVQSTVTVIGGVTGAVGLASGAFLLGAPKAVEFYDALGRMGSAGSGAQTAIRRMALTLSGPWGVAIGAATVAGGFLINSWIDQKQAVETYRTSLDEATASITENTRKVAAKVLQEEGALTTARKLNVAESIVVDAVLGSAEAQGVLADAIEATRKKAEVYRDENGLMVANTESQESARDLLGDLNVLERQIGVQGETIKTAVSAQEELTRATEGTGGATRDVIGQFSTLTTNVETLGVVANEAVDPTDQMGAAIESAGIQADEAEERVETWRKSMASIAESFVAPLDAYTGLLAEKTEAEQASAQATADSTDDAEDSWEDHVSEVSVSLDEYSTRLEEQNENQEQWRSNLVKIVQSGRSDIAQELAAMGPEGADLVAKFANGTSAETERAAEEMRADMQFGREGVVTELEVMDRVGRATAKDTAEGIAEELEIGADEVSRIALKYSGNLADGLNPLLDALGRKKVNLSTRRTGVTATAQADGSVYGASGAENHVAQIARAGEWRVWAEDETGGEAYIPLSPAKRKRSTEIWRETGKRLGIPAGSGADYADGGFHSVGSIPKPGSTSPYRAPISTAGAATMGKGYDEVRKYVEANAVVPDMGGGMGALPGGGGASLNALIAYGRALRSQGLRVSSNAALGSPPSPGAHSPTGYHYRYGNSGAIDVNSHAGESAAEKRRLSPIALDMRRRGFAVQWLSPGHYNHLHADIGNYTRIGNTGAWMGGGGGGNRAMAKGGIFNPHVRDRGGPLLPGLTMNGTGGTERTTVLAPGQRVVDGSGRYGGSGGTTREEHTHIHIDAKDAVLRTYGHQLARQALAEKDAQSGRRLAGIAS